jgi:hypothetical protein
MTTDDEQDTEQTQRINPPHESPYKLSTETKEGLMIADALILVVVIIDFLAPFITDFFGINGQIPYFSASWWAVAILAATFWHTPERMTEEVASRRADRKMIAAGIALIVSIMLVGVPVLFPVTS